MQATSKRKVQTMQASELAKLKPLTVKEEKAKEKLMGDWLERLSTKRGASNANTKA